VDHSCPRCGFDPAMPIGNEPPVRLPSGVFVPAWSKTKGGILVPEHVHAELAAPTFAIGIDHGAPAGSYSTIAYTPKSYPIEKFSIALPTVEDFTRNVYRDMLHDVVRSMAESLCSVSSLGSIQPLTDNVLLFRRKE
jgi:hypothetical protein